MIPCSKYGIYIRIITYIPTIIYYKLSLRIQGAFSYLGHKKGDFPNSEECSEKKYSYNINNG